MKKGLVRFEGEDHEIDLPQSIVNLHNYKDELFENEAKEFSSLIEAIPEDVYKFDIPEVTSNEDAILELYTIIDGFISQKLGVLTGKDTSMFYIEYYDSDDESFEFLALAMDFSNIGDVRA